MNKVISSSSNDKTIELHEGKSYSISMVTLIRDGYPHILEDMLTN